MLEDRFYRQMMIALEKASDLLKEGFGTNLTIRDKDGSNNIVTEYDFRSEELIKKTISHEFPNHSFLAEESGLDSKDASYRWIIDPLDGTVNFANRIPVFCISIALEIDGQIHCGAICNPVTGERFTAVRGQGSYFGQARMSISTKNDVEKSLLATGFPYRMKEKSDSIISIINSAIRRGIPIRRLGAAAIDLAYTADGRFEGFWETGLNPWDVAAGILMVRESGGMVKNFSGDDYSIGDDTIVAGPSAITNSMLEILRENEN